VIFHSDLFESNNAVLHVALRYCKARGLIHQGVYAPVNEIVGSRSRAGALRFKLQADMHTPGRRHVNAGTAKYVDRHDLPWAATYDEWGWVLAYLFRDDPHGHCGTGRYASEADFHHQTHDAYRLPREEPAVDITTYEQADAYIRGGSDLYQRTIRGLKATQVIRRIDGIALRYHDTDVVHWHPNGDTTLNTGGWLTQTTSSRMCDFTRLRVYPDAGRWKVAPIPGPNQVPLWHRSLPVVDGMRIDRDGWLVSGVDFTQVEREDEWNAKVRNLLTKARRKYRQGAAGLDVVREADCEHCEANHDLGREIQPGTERDHYLQHLAAIVAGQLPNVHLCQAAVVRAGYANDHITPSWTMLRMFLVERLLVGNVMGAPSGRRPSSFDAPQTWQRGA